MRLIFIEILMNYLRRNSDKLLFLALGLITFYLCINFSKDWVAYNIWYHKEAQEITWEYFLHHYNPFREQLYQMMSKGVAEFIGFTGFVLITTVSLLFIKLRFLGKIIDSPYVGTFFYVCLYLLLFEGTGIRVGYAVALLVIAIYLLNLQKYLYSLLLILMASQIHFTALIFLLIYPLYFFRKLNWIVYFLFLLAPFLIIFDITVLNSLKHIIYNINPRYLIYYDIKPVNQNSTGLYFYFIAFFSFILIAIYVFLRDAIVNDKFVAATYSMSLLGVILMCTFHENVAVGARLGELLLVTIVILLSWLYLYFCKRKMYVYQLLLIMMFMIYFCARFLYLYPIIYSLNKI